MLKLPVASRMSFLYLEKGVLQRDGHALVLAQEDRRTPLPVSATAVLMLGPGVTVTHAAIALAASEGTLLLWTGEHGVRLYASANPRGNANRLIAQVAAYSTARTRLAVARRLHARIFETKPPPRMSVAQLRGLEGSLAKAYYGEQATLVGIEWGGRSEDLSIPINRALAGANAALYGLTEAVILALGYSPAIGFIHSGDARSFVFDLADTVKFKTVVPLAFKIASETPDASESTIRKATRDLFHMSNLAQTLVDQLDTLFDDCDI